MISAVAGIEVVFDIVEDPFGQMWQTVKNIQYVSRKGSILDLNRRAWGLLNYLLWRFSKINFAITEALVDRIMTLTKKEALLVPILSHTKSSMEIGSEHSHIEDNYFCWAGTVDITKEGLLLLIEAFSKFHKLYPEVKLLLIGSGNRHAVSYIKEVILKDDLSDRIILKGFVSDDVLHDYLSNSIGNIVAKEANPLNRYNFPTKLIDYFQAGVPIILPDFEYLKKYFNSESVIFFASSDTEDLSRRMEFAYRDSKRLRALCRRKRFPLLPLTPIEDIFPHRLS